MVDLRASAERPARVATHHRRAATATLAVLGLTAALLAVVDARAGVGGGLRAVSTAAFLLLGPGWAVAGFLRRVPAALLWIAAAGLGAALGALAATVMLGPVGWHPVGALWVAVVLAVPVLVRHAVVAR